MIKTNIYITSIYNLSEMKLRIDISKMQHYLRSMELTFREMNYDGDTEMKLGYDKVLFSPQCFKLRVINILDITSFDWFSLDKPKET